MSLNKKVVAPLLLLTVLAVSTGCGNKGNSFDKKVYVPKKEIKTYNNVDYSFVLESAPKKGYEFTDGLLDYKITNVVYNKGDLSLDLVVTSRGSDIKNFMLPVMSFSNSGFKGSKDPQDKLVSLKSDINKPIYIPKNTQFTVTYKNTKDSVIGTFGDFHVNSSVGAYKFRYSFLTGQNVTTNQSQVKGGDKNE